MNKNIWIFSIYYDQPITVEGLKEYLTYLKNIHTNKVLFTFAKRIRSFQTYLEDLHSAFDQVRPAVYS